MIEFYLMMLTSSFVSLYYYRIVGQVAISGQHQWIFSEYLNDSHSTFQVGKYARC